MRNVTTRSVNFGLFFQFVLEQNVEMMLLVIKFFINLLTILVWERNWKKVEKACVCVCAIAASMVLWQLLAPYWRLPFSLRNSIVPHWVYVPESKYPAFPHLSFRALVKDNAIDQKSSASNCKFGPICMPNLLKNWILPGIVCVFPQKTTAPFQTYGK